MLINRKLAAGLAALAVAVPAAALAVTPAAHAAVPATISLTVKNTSGRNEPVYLYVMGEHLTTKQQGYADVNGTFHPWTNAALPPVPAPDVSIPGPANGQSVTIKIPQLAGRVYYSIGAKLKFFVTIDGTGKPGLVQPNPSNTSDPNAATLYDWSEYTLNPLGIWLNSSQVDQFSVPHTVGVKRPDGSISSEGRMITNGRSSFFAALAGQPGGWANLITYRSGWPLRAIAPLKGIETGKLPPSILDSAITRAWNTYKTRTLTVVPFTADPSTKYFGTVSGNVMTFKNTSGAAVYSISKPSSADVFGCSGKGTLEAPNDPLKGPIARTLCAALNRGTLDTVSTQPDVTASHFYTVADSNQYSRKIHARMLDGKAYGFPFDDVGNFEALVHDGNPQQAYITIDPLA